jgi:hypothetical protein
VIKREGESTTCQVHEAADAFINVPLGFQIMADCARHVTGFEWARLHRIPSENDLNELGEKMRIALEMCLRRSDHRAFRSEHDRRCVINGVVDKMTQLMHFETLGETRFRLTYLAFAFIECQPAAFQTEWAVQWTSDNIEAYRGKLSNFTADQISCPKGIFERFFHTISSMYPTTVPQASNHMRRNQLLAWTQAFYEADPDGYTVAGLRGHIRDQIARLSDDNNPADWVQVVEDFVATVGQSMAGGSVRAWARGTGAPRLTGRRATR